MEKLKDLFAQYVSEEMLTEDNLGKIEVMFESAINEAIKVKTEELDEIYNEKLKTEMESFETTVNEGLDGYLSTFVKEFTEENKVALTNRLMVEKAETILNSIQNVFAENGINIPSTSESFISELNEKYEDMENKYNKVQNENIELSKTVTEMGKATAFIIATEGLVETDKERVMNLLDGLVVEDVEEFKSKLNIIIEKVTKEDDKSEDDKSEDDEDEVNKDDNDDEAQKESNDTWSKAYQNMRLN